MKNNFRSVITRVYDITMTTSSEGVKASIFTDTSIETSPLVAMFVLWILIRAIT